MRFILSILLIALSVSSYAGDIFYPVSSIPESLLKNANVVKRMEEIRFEIISTNETVLHQKYALTILNENGDRAATFHEYYDKLRQVRSIEGKLFDANGKAIKSLKPKDIQDVSGVDDNNLMDDNRVKYHHFYHKVYPYTVEYEVEIRYNNSLFFPYWFPQESEFLSVEKSQFVLVCPQNYTVRHRAFNYKGEMQEGTLKDKKTLTWQVNNLLAIKRQFASPAWNELTTAVFFAPTDFQIDDYKGNMNNWQEFGKFVYTLKKERDALPEEVKQKVRQLLSGLSTEKEKVKALYRYLQQNTRYVSIQLGIGGWQPFDAADVAKKGYGDCKALTNYMYSLLKEAGINSYYALVQAGDNKRLIEDLPSQQFNHVILCVPLPKDTLWLECTSQTLPAGYVSDFTANRKALLVDENGGRLVPTPQYGIEENIQIRKINAKVDAEGYMDVKIQTRYKAMQQDNLHSLIHNLSKEKVKEILQEALSLATYNVNNFSYQEADVTVPEIKEELDLSISNYATVSGKRLFVVPNLINRSTTQLNEDEERKWDIHFSNEYIDIDSVEIEIPEGYSLEAMPHEVFLKTKFGSYKTTLKVEKNKLFYSRIREFYAGKWASKDYPGLVKFLADIYKADRARVVFVKKE